MPIDMAITETTQLLKALKIKLEAGASNTLAIIIGIVKIKRLRPFEISTKLSLKVNTNVIRIKKIVDAIFPDQYLFRKNITTMPISKTKLAEKICHISKVLFKSLAFSATIIIKISANNSNTVIPKRSMLSNFLLRASLGSVEGIVTNRLRLFKIIYSPKLMRKELPNL